MEGRSAQIADDVRLGFDNRHGNRLLGEQQRDAKPDRAAAGNDHFGVASARDDRRRGCRLRWM